MTVACACGGKKDPSLEYVVQVRGESGERVFADKVTARAHAVATGKGATVVARRKTK